MLQREVILPEEQPRAEVMPRPSEPSSVFCDELWDWGVVIGLPLSVLILMLMFGFFLIF